MITRRGLITTLLVAPAIVRATSLMPVKAWTELPPRRVIICAPEVNPISGPWSTYLVKPGERIWRGDCVVIGADGYARSVEFPQDFAHQHLAGIAMVGSHEWKT